MEPGSKETNRQAAGDGNQTDGSVEENKQTDVRQNAFVVFSNEKDLRHHEAIRIKASHYTGIALRVKVITPSAMENLLYAMDLDSGEAKKKKNEEGDGKGGKGKDGKDGKDAKGKDAKDQPPANDTVGAALLASIK